MEKKQMPNIANEKVEEAIREYAKERTKDNLSRVVNLLRPTSLYVPAMINEEKRPVPYFLKNSEGDPYLAVFTSPEQASEDVKKKAVMLMPFTVCNGIVSNDQFALMGMVINPYTDNLILKTELVRQLHEADLKLAQRMKTQKENMSPDQYVQYMRNQIEFGVMPKRLFDEGAAFVDELCEKKEEALNGIFEKGFRENNPFGRSDFAVMALTISSSLMLVRIDMPAGKKPAPYCVRVYITWNPESREGGYYTIESIPDKKEHRLGSIERDGKHTDLGEAPVEGLELQKIMELAGEKL